MKEGTRVRVALVEDKRLTREGLASILSDGAGLQVVGAWVSVEQALPALEAASCDVLLLDIGLPGMSGVDAVKIFRERFPCMQILMLTVYEDDDRVFQSLCNGASGYLLKKTPPTQILEAVRQANLGGSPLSPEVASRIVRVFRQRPAGPSRSPLTAQEARLLRLLADGYSYQSAADAMEISINTVRDHVRCVYEKLQVHSKSEAVGKALRDRLID